MSSFSCEFCGKAIIDSPTGYRTQCKHYPKEALRSGTSIDGELIRHALPDGRVNVINCGTTLRARIEYPVRCGVGV